MSKLEPEKTKMKGNKHYISVLLHYTFTIFYITNFHYKGNITYHLEQPIGNEKSTHLIYIFLKFLIQFSTIHDNSKFFLALNISIFKHIV